MKNSQPNENWFFLRGLTREASHFGQFPEQFTRRFPKRRVFCLDLPGNGTRYLEKSPLSVTKMVEAIRQEFLSLSQKNPADRSYLFCISLGAMVGVDWMRSYPDDFHGATLINTSLRGLSPFYLRLRSENYPTILRLLLLKNIEERERLILNLTSNRHGFDVKIAKDWVEIQKKRPISRLNAIRQIIAASRFHAPLVAPINNILVLNGAADRLVDPRCSLALQSAWGLEVRQHPQAGHDLTLDEPEWVLQQIESFFG